MNRVNVASKIKERPITEGTCRKRLREVGITISRKKFCSLVEEHHVPFTENALQCRGGTPNRYYEWATIKPFFEGFIRQVN